jgi:type IV secretion system protein VirB9
MVAVLAASAALVCPAPAQTRAEPAASDKTAQPIASKPAVVAVPVPLARPGRIEPLVQGSLPSPARRSRSSSSPRDDVGAANDAARIEPDRTGFVNAIQQYSYADGALYQVYARPGNVTDIALQEGERLVGPGPVAAGDTARWMIGDTVSGTGPAARVHLLIKPIRSDIATNLVINTDRRTYHLELRANPSVYMASVSWTYPQDELIALRKAQDAEVRATPVAAGIDLASLDFGYEIEGDRPAWRPLRAFDDGVRVFIAFPESAARGELPPLFVLGTDDRVELVNYRVSGRYMIVDRLFARAELRLEGRKGGQKVRIVSNRRRPS